MNEESAVIRVAKCLMPAITKNSVFVASQTQVTALVTLGFHDSKAGGSSAVSINNLICLDNFGVRFIS
jgi:hypothetical protein